MTTSLKKTLLVSLVVPAIALTAACTSGSNDDKWAAPSSAKADSGGTAAQEPAPAEPADGVTAESLNGSAAFSNSGAQKSALTSADRQLANAPGLAPASGVSGSDAAGSDAAERTSPEVDSAAVISKGQISLHSKDIDAARFDLQRVLDTLNGTIDDEQSSANKEGKTIRQRLVLRVPSKYFGKAMDRMSRIEGTKLVSRSRSSEDVTTQVIDNKTRIRTQRASLARIQALLAQATNLSQIISIESQLSRRQAALDSLEAQQKYLADQTSMSTINVYLTVPAKKHAAGTHKKGHDFFSGFKSGWNHLGTSTNAVLTGVGAVLPFAALAALIGFPAWAAWRRRAPKPAAEPVPAA